MGELWYEAKYNCRIITSSLGYLFSIVRRKRHTCSARQTTSHPDSTVIRQSFHQKDRSCSPFERSGTKDRSSFANSSERKRRSVKYVSIIPSSCIAQIKGFARFLMLCIICYHPSRDVGLKRIHGLEVQIFFLCLTTTDSTVEGCDIYTD